MVGSRMLGMEVGLLGMTRMALDAMTRVPDSHCRRLAYSHPARILHGLHHYSCQFSRIVRNGKNRISMRSSRADLPGHVMLGGFRKDIT